MIFIEKIDDFHRKSMIFIKKTMIFMEKSKIFIENPWFPWFSSKKSKIFIENSWFSSKNHAFHRKNAFSIYLCVANISQHSSKKMYSPSIFVNATFRNISMKTHGLLLDGEQVVFVIFIEKYMMRSDICSSLYTFFLKISNYRYRLLSTYHG